MCSSGAFKCIHSAVQPSPSPSPEVCLHPSWNSVPFKQWLPMFPLQSLITYSLLSVSMSYTISDAWYKVESYTICSFLSHFLHLISPKLIYIVSKFHSSLKEWKLFHYKIENSSIICVDSILFIHSTTSGSWAVSTFWLLWVLLWTLGCKCKPECLLSVLWCIHIQKWNCWITWYFCV